MNEERTMILKMLKEGKISMEEAEALLEVLEESDKQERSGHESEPTREQEKSWSESGPDHDREKPHTEERSGEFEDLKNQFKQGFEGFGKSFSEGFEGFGKSMEGFLKNVEHKVKEAMKSIKDVDIDINIGDYLDSSLWKTNAKEERTMEIPGSGIEELLIDLPWGDCIITGSDDHDIHIAAEITAWGADEEDAGERVRRLNLEPVTEGNTLKLIIKRDESEQPGKRSRFPRVDIRITMPSDINLSCSNKSGDLKVSGLNGKTETQSYSGDIRLTRISGKLTGKSKSGDISAEEIEGEAVLETLSGDVEIEGVTGNLSAASKSGDVEVQNFEGDGQIVSISGDCEVRIIGRSRLAAKSTSGDVSVSISSDSNPSELDLRSTSGDINVRAAEDLTGTVELSSRSGTVHSGFGLDAEDKSGKYIRGILGKPEGSVFCRTTSGDVELSPA
ncbi:MAG: DUF4097 family beta strand repeat-containing protein [Spirochaetia bacterium]